MGKTVGEAVGLLEAGQGKGDSFVSFSLEFLQQPLSGLAAARSQHLAQISETAKPLAMVTAPYKASPLLRMPELHGRVLRHGKRNLESRGLSRPVPQPPPTSQTSEARGTDLVLRKRPYELSR